MDRIGVFVCNYNKKDMVVQCVQSILNQTMTQIDVYVVDNASSDGSVEALKRRFGNRIVILENKENLGGSGGFNTGLRRGIQNNYDYLVLADNDVVMADNAIECLYHYMKEHSEVGLCGAKILEKQSPQIIQEMGGTLQLNQFRVVSYYHRNNDSERIPKELNCDFVSACTLMANGKAMNEIGVMDDDFYIYMDDIEWCIRMKQAGYRIAVCGDARVWHEKQAINAMPSNTFARYYLWRNKIYLFSKYVEEHDLELLSEEILRNTFNIIYGNLFKHLYQENVSVLYALEDFINGIRGKAKEGRILPMDYSYDPFRQIIEGKVNILIYFDGDYSFREEKRCYEALKKILTRIMEIEPKCNIFVHPEDQQQASTILVYLNEFFQSNLPIHIETNQGEAMDLELKICGHCNWVSENILPVIYVDERFNCIRNSEEVQYFLNYEQEYRTFRIQHYDSLIEGMRRVRGDGL